MRYWYDTEFIDDGFDIDLISIGIVAEDGRELYMQSSEFNLASASEWVHQNVFPHLVLCPHLPPQLNLLVHNTGQCTDDCPWHTREQMKRKILHFMLVEQYGESELWGYYSAYDHVAFCQLFGTMMQLPKGYPMYTRDIKQWCDQLGNPKLPEQGEDEHNALADARWNKVVWEFLKARDTYQLMGT